MKWLVTGGLGFIGSNFIIQAMNQYPNLHIVCLDKNTYAANKKNLYGVECHRFKLIIDDIVYPDAVADAIEGCDTVVNFAAETHVDRSIEWSTPFINTNVLGVGVLLNSALEADATFIQVSTDEVYGPNTRGFNLEVDKLNPTSPYAASKAAAELLIESFHKTHGLRYAITRGCNTYGPRQFPEKLVPKAITNLLYGRKVPVYGDGTQERQWIHVTDHVDAILRVIELNRCGTFNIAGRTMISNIELVKTLVEMCGETDDKIEFVADRPGHDVRYCIANNNINNVLDVYPWEPKVPFYSGLLDTVKWYEGYYAE